MTTMKDRLLLLVTGIACASLAWLAWRRFPLATGGLIVLAPVVGQFQQRRHRKRMAQEDAARIARRDARERPRQLRRLAQALAAVRDRRRP